MVELVFYEEVPGLSSEFFLKWFQTVCVSENQTLGEVSLVFGGDDWLLEKNKEYRIIKFFKKFTFFNV